MTKDQRHEEELRQYGLIITHLHSEIWRLRDALKSLTLADKYHDDAQNLIRDAQDVKAGRKWLKAYRQGQNDKLSAK